MKKLSFLFLAILMVGAGLSCGKGSKTDQRNAMIHLVAGDVQCSINDGQDWNAVKMGDKVPAQAVIRTGSGAFCDILIADAAIIRVKELTRLVLADLYYNKGSGQERTRLKMDTGTALVKVRKLMKEDSSFSMETPSAVVGVRGTEFLVRISEEKDTSIAVNEGRVGVKPAVTIATSSTLPVEVKENIQKEISVEKDTVSVVRKDTVDRITAAVEKAESGKPEGYKDIVTTVRKFEKQSQTVEPDKTVVNEMKDFEILREVAKTSLLPAASETPEVKAEKEKPSGETKTVQGSLVWKYSGSGAIKSDVLSEAGRIYFASAEGATCVDTASGKKWTFSLPSGTSSSPVSAGELVLIAGNDGLLYALSKSSGTPVWKKDTGTVAYGKPCVANGMIYLGTSTGRLVALNAASGEQMWTYSTVGGIYTTPFCTQDQIVFGCEDGSVTSLDINGKLKWNFKTGGRIIKSSPVINQKNIYCGSSDGFFYCISANDGALKWKYQTGGKILSTVALSGDSAVFVSTDGILYCLNSQNGALIWQKKIGIKPESSPVIAGTTVYAAADSGEVGAYSLSNGELLWKTPVGSRITGALSLLGGRVYAGLDSGELASISR
jgi:outer membrane protein assembly factor BamB